MARNSEKVVARERISLPIIGRVNATQNSRTGIMTKTRSLQQSREGSKAELLVADDDIQGETSVIGAGTNPQPRRSSSREVRVISRVSSRYTGIRNELEGECQYEASDPDSQDSGEE